MKIALIALALLAFVGCTEPALAQTSEVSYKVEIFKIDAEIGPIRIENKTSIGWEGPAWTKKILDAAGDLISWLWYKLPGTGYPDVEDIPMPPIVQDTGGVTKTFILYDDTGRTNRLVVPADWTDGVILH